MTTPSVPPIALAIELSGVAEVVASGDGFWRTCSGCHESEDGHDVGHYPHSDVFGCTLGGGCSECGGIGAVWDDTDYEAMADMGDMYEIAAPTPSASSVPDQKAFDRAWYRYDMYPTEYRDDGEIKAYVDPDTEKAWRVCSFLILQANGATK